MRLTLQVRNPFFGGFDGCRKSPLGCAPSDIQESENDVAHKDGELITDAPGPGLLYISNAYSAMIALHLEWTFGANTLKHGHGARSPMNSVSSARCQFPFVRVNCKTLGASSGIPLWMFGGLPGFVHQPLYILWGMCEVGCRYKKLAYPSHGSRRFLLQLAHIPTIEKYYIGQLWATNLSRHFASMSP